VFSIAMTGLGGETPDQLNLFVRKGTNFLAVDADHPGQLVVPEQRDDKERPNSRFNARNHERIATGVRREGLYILNMRDLPGRDDLRETGTRARTDRSSPDEFHRPTKRARWSRNLSRVT
jgi:hypothetical protein